MGEVRYDVVVVGAGVSGLVCATALHAAGTTVAVLEARRRVGGRLLSLPVDGPDPGAALDLGATWFWPHHHLLAAETTRLGIGTFAQYTAGDALLEAPGSVGTPVSRRIPGNPLDVESGRLRAGAQSLARSLARQLPGGAVRLGSPVGAIRAAGDALLVRAGHHELSADQAVLALPPSLAVTTIEITPALPRSLVALARRTPTWMAGTAKVVARYRRAFWREQGLAGAAISHVGPLREIHDMSGADGEPAALFGFAPATTPPDPMLGDRARAQLARLFGAEAGDPVELHVRDWSAEPYTCSPDPPAGAAHHLLGHPAYQEPALDGRLHWAGTETSAAHAGHIEGALEAGVRASVAVLSRRPSAVSTAEPHRPSTDSERTMFKIAELLAEYDRARAYTDELWRDLSAEELHWRPEDEFSPIGWHLGHQAHVAHFMVRNLTAAEPSPMPDLDGVMDSANPEKLRLPLPTPARLGEFRDTVAA